MKKGTIGFAIFIWAAVSMFVIAETSYAGWVLYDDFNSGTIDPAKWYVSGDSADVSVKKGKAVFMHKNGYPEKSTYLRFPNDLVPSIKGVKVTMQMVKVTNDLRARIVAVVANQDDNSIIEHINVEPNRVNGPYTGLNGVFFQTDLIGSQGQWIKSIFYSQFLDYTKPEDLIGKNLVVYLDFRNLGNLIYGVKDLGEGAQRLPNLSAQSGHDLIGIGTRSNSGNGSGMVKFDNVYVLQ